MDVHPFEGLDGQNHQTTEHAKGEGDSNRGLMPRPLQETPVLHELSIGQDAATATQTPAAADYETAFNTAPCGGAPVGVAIVRSLTHDNSGTDRL